MSWPGCPTLGELLRAVPRLGALLLALLAATALPAAGTSAAAAPAGEAPADGELAGRKLVDLAVEGAESLSAETVLFHLGLDVGGTLEPAELDRRVRALWDHGLLEDLTVDGEAVEGGARLVVRIVERPVVSSLEYRGLQRVRASEITDRLALEHIRVAEGELLRRGELRRLEAAVEEMYRERGFQLAHAVTATEELDGGVAVVVTVDEGKRLRVGEIGFEGNTAFSDSRLRRAVRESRPTGWISRARRKDRFDRAALARDLERVADVYRRAGYKDVTVGEPRVELVREGNARRVTITVPVEEGDRWKLGGIGFTGNRQLSDSRLLELFERPGSGWLGSRFVDEGVERVRDLYGRGGFMTAKVEPVFVERPDLVADVMVRIDEGERYRVGRIEVEGNTTTRDKVIRRELAVQEGQVLDATALRRSLLRLGQLDFFDLDDEEPVRFDLDEESGRVDLTLQGREADSTNLFFGGGYGQTHGLFGEVRYSSRNFRGRGETLSANLQKGADLTQVQLGYTVPWLLDRRQSLGGDLFVREETFDAGGESLARELSGGRLRWGRRLGLFQSLTLGYSWEDVLDSRARLDAAGGTLFQSFDRRISSLELGYLLDRVDSLHHPTRGLRLSGSLEAAGGALGGDSRYLRSRAAFNLFRPLGGGRKPRFVLGLSAEGGAVRPLGGGELTFNDRFFRGGDGSVRGFDVLGLHPRDETGASLLDANGFLLGGDRFLEAALELHAPLNDVLRLVAFADAGNVWAESQSFDLGSLRYTAGVELRVTTPLFPQPLRFIWAENLDPLPGDSFKSFQFSFGVGF